MAVRVLTCPHCSHRMRLGAAHCGNCGSAAPMNVILVFILFVSGALALALIGTVLIGG